MFIALVGFLPARACHPSRTQSAAGRIRPRGAPLPPLTFLPDRTRLPHPLSSVGPILPHPPFLRRPILAEIGHLGIGAARRRLDRRAHTTSKDAPWALRLVAMEHTRRMLRLVRDDGGLRGEQSLQMREAGLREVAVKRLVCLRAVIAHTCELSLYRPTSGTTLAKVPPSFQRRPCGVTSSNVVTSHGCISVAWAPTLTEKRRSRFEQIVLKMHVSR